MNPEDSERWTRFKTDKYHDSLDCRTINLPDQFSQWSVEYCERRDLEPCGYCHDELDAPGGGDNNPDWSYQNALQEAAKANDD